MAELHLLPLCDAAPPVAALLAAATQAEGTLAWFRVLAETTLAPGEQALAAVLTESGAATAVLPLAAGRRGVRGLTAPYTTCFLPAFASGGAARALGCRARSFAGGVMRLDACDLEQPVMAAFFDGLQQAGLAVVRYGHFANWYETIADFDSWWAARSSRLKNTLRRKRAAAERAGIGLSYAAGSSVRALDAYDEIHRASWKEAEPYPSFLPMLVRELGREGMVRMGVMTLAGHAVAAQIWLIRGKRGTLFKLAHREDAAEYSPGTVLTHWMVETLVRDEGVTEFDFGRGDDGYKRDWFDKRRIRTGVIAADWRTIAGLGVTLRDVLPTLGARAFREQFGGNRAASVTTEH